MSDLEEGFKRAAEAFKRLGEGLMKGGDDDSSVGDAMLGIHSYTTDTRIRDEYVRMLGVINDPELRGTGCVFSVYTEADKDILVRKFRAAGYKVEYYKSVFGYYNIKIERNSLQL